MREGDLAGTAAPAPQGGTKARQIPGNQGCAMKLGSTEEVVPAKSIAILIPCYNEELTVAEVVRQFRSALPHANIYVFDNNSSDRTAELARQAGARVCYERRQGKGHVVQSMFRQVEADIYVMVDGDGTYPPAAVHELIKPILNREADMVVGSRLHDQSQSQFNWLNLLGNKMYLSLLNTIFRVKLTDILSGYRAFTREFVQGIPLFGGGFEIEAELTIKALERGYQIVEVPIGLRHRPEGSHSKIRLIHDGMIILSTILTLFRDYKPLTFFGSVGLLLMIGGLIPGSVVILEFIKTGLVLRVPLAILAVGLVLSGMLGVTVGTILHTMNRRFQEFEYLLKSLTKNLNQ